MYLRRAAGGPWHRRHVHVAVEVRPADVAGAPGGARPARDRHAPPARLRRHHVRAPGRRPARLAGRAARAREPDGHAVVPEAARPVARAVHRPRHRRVALDGGVRHAGAAGSRPPGRDSSTTGVPVDDFAGGRTPDEVRSIRSALGLPGPGAGGRYDHPADAVRRATSTWSTLPASCWTRRPTPTSASLARGSCGTIWRRRRAASAWTAACGSRATRATSPGHSPPSTSWLSRRSGKGRRSRRSRRWRPAAPSSRPMRTACPTSSTTAGTRSSCPSGTPERWREPSSRCSGIPSGAAELAAAAAVTGAAYDIGVFVRKLERLYELMDTIRRTSGRRGVAEADLGFLSALGHPS